MKLKYFFIILLLSLPIITAKICEDRLDETESCIMLTPHIVCSNNNYDIINQTNGGILQNDYNLTLLNNSIYWFNFSLTTGDYIIQFCDNSTREIRVTETLEKSIKNTKMEIILGIIFGLVVFFCVYLVGQFQEDYFKFFFVFVALIFLVLGVNSLKIIAVSNNSEASLLNMIDLAYSVLIWVVWIAGIFMAIYTLFKAFDYINKLWRKREYGE